MMSTAERHPVHHPQIPRMRTPATPGLDDDHDTDISNLLAEKNVLHKAIMEIQTDTTKVAFFRCFRLVQQRLWELQDAWIFCRSEEIQGYVDRNEMKNCFKAIKAIYGPRIKGKAPLLSYDDTIFQE
ncbi:unnamed protein product [Schistocephalus solidus]|uniref:DDE_Tnp_1_7 domain-containing protein n=1 Tax=Schistocephalus solidus TaxID=70667 RepID=A0A183SZU2_SCHSO|nr:unnamed protein product [Schistocephalus solidus]